MNIFLIRHGESKSNTNEIDRTAIGDHDIPLTERGMSQAYERGRSIGRAVLESSLVYCSPYLRARQTLAGIFSGAGSENSPKIYEDPRLREIDHGYGSNVDDQEDLRRVHGWFYYRFRGGESPADGYDRCSHFIETMMRQFKRKQGFVGSPKNIIIVSHGLTIRCFALRFMHLSVETFDFWHNPKNCDVLHIGLQVENPQYQCGKWFLTGLKMRETPRTHNEP